MLNKDQALASMDAHIIRAEAERKLRLERRLRRFNVLYPALRSVPLEEREALVLRASKQSLRRWPVHAMAIIVVMCFGAAFFIPNQPIGSRPTVEIGITALVLASVPVIAFYLHVREYIKREAAVRVSGQSEQRGASGSAK